MVYNRFFTDIATLLCLRLPRFAQRLPHSIHYVSVPLALYRACHQPAHHLLLPQHKDEHRGDQNQDEPSHDQPVGEPVGKG